MIFYIIYVSVSVFRAGYIRKFEHDGCIALLPNSHNGSQRFAGDPYTPIHFALGDLRLFWTYGPLKIFAFAAISQTVHLQSIHLGTVAAETVPVRARECRCRTAAGKKKNPVNWILLFYFLY